MANAIDRSWVYSLGLTKDDEKLTQLHRTITNELEHRVGTVLSSRLTPAQMAQFEKIMKSGIKGEEIKFLSYALPDYPDTVKTKTDQLKREIETATDKIAFIESLPHSH